MRNEGGRVGVNEKERTRTSAKRYEEGEGSESKRGGRGGERHSASRNTISVQCACVLRSRRERVEANSRVCTPGS